MSNHARPLIPSELRFTYQPWGVVENVIDISLDGEKLIGNFGYWDGTRIPTEKEWKIFEISLDACGVWDWKGYYGPERGEPPLCDGTPWNIWIRWGSKVKRSSGSGEFPESFERVEQAIKQLIGKQGQ
jgi:hypothetical protein